MSKKYYSSWFLNLHPNAFLACLWLKQKSFSFNIWFSPSFSTIPESEFKALNFLNFCNKSLFIYRANLVTTVRYKNPILSVLYNYLMTRILVLQFDCLVQEKYAAFLYPIVEFAQLEDIPRAWNRSHFKQNEKPLSKLLDFVGLEVESEERFLVARITEYLIISSTIYYIFLILHSKNQRRQWFERKIRV